MRPRNRGPHKRVFGGTRPEPPTNNAGIVRGTRTISKRIFHTRPETFDDDDMKRVLRQLREKERYLERLIYLREIIDAKNTAVDEFKAESPEDYNQLKRIDDSVDRKSLRTLRLMKKVLRNDDLTSEEKRVAIKEITD